MKIKEKQVEAIVKQLLEIIDIKMTEAFDMAKLKLTDPKLVDDKNMPEWFEKFSIELIKYNEFACEIMDVVRELTATVRVVASRLNRLERSPLVKDN